MSEVGSPDEEQKLTEDRYLSHALLDHLLPEGVNHESLMKRRVILSAEALVQILNEAKRIYTETPGVNQHKRKSFAGGWFDPWIQMLKLKSKNDNNIEKTGPNGTLQISSQILTWEQLSKRVKKSGEWDYDAQNDQLTRNKDIFAAWAIGGGEGLEHHRLAAQYVGKKCNDKNITGVLLFGPESWMSLKDRGQTFLPRAVIMSMWVHFMELSGYKDILFSMIPEPGRPLTEREFNEYFSNLFRNQIRFQYYFAMQMDPDHEAKLMRGTNMDLRLFQMVFDFTIPYFEDPSTSDAVERLMSDLRQTEDENGIRELLNLILPGIPTDAYI